MSIQRAVQRGDDAAAAAAVSALAANLRAAFKQEQVLEEDVQQCGGGDRDLERMLAKGMCRAARAYLTSCLASDVEAEEAFLVVAGSREEGFRDLAIELAEQCSDPEVLMESAIRTDNVAATRTLLRTQGFLFRLDALMQEAYDAESWNVIGYISREFSVSKDVPIERMSNSESSGRAFVMSQELLSAGQKSCAGFPGGSQ